MAEEKTINTRILLRNDTLAKWAASNVQLLKGEVAFAFTDDLSTKVQMMVGNGLSTWLELSNALSDSMNGNLMLKPGNIEGLSDYIATLSVEDTNTKYCLSNVALLSGEPEKSKSYQLMSQEKGATTWTAVENSRFNVPEFDPGVLSGLSGQLSTLSLDLSALSGEVSACSSYVINQLCACSSDITSSISVLSDEVSACSAYVLNQVSAVSSTITSDVSNYVKYSDVLGGKNAISANNKLVTEKDIAQLTGVMHFKGVATNNALSTGDTTVPVPPYKTGDKPISGDFVIDKVGSEFVWGLSSNETTSFGCWYKVGDETLYAKQVEFEAVSTDLYTKTNVSVDNLCIALSGLSSHVYLCTDISVANLKTEIDGVKADDQYLSSVLSVVEDNYLSGVSINGLSASVANHVAAFTISCIYCGGANDLVIG